jgi:predicted N-formylglutamate amidohydrolase
MWQSHRIYRSSFFRPEICLGTDKHHTDQSVTAYFSGFFRQAGLEVGINTPFFGNSRAAITLLGRDLRAQSIMIEIRLDLYMDVDESTGAVNSNYDRIQRTLRTSISGLVNEEWSHGSLVST